MSQHLQHHQTQYVHYNPNPHLQHHHQQQHHQQQQQQQQAPLQQQQHALTHIAPQDTQHQQQQQLQQQQQALLASTSTEQAQQQAGGSGSSPAPLIARGDWTKDLVQLAKTAELKKHALTLQLHTAHILSAHATLEQKGKAIQDLREQKNKRNSGWKASDQDYWPEVNTRLALILFFVHQSPIIQVNADRDKVKPLQACPRSISKPQYNILQVDMMEHSLEKESVNPHSQCTVQSVNTINRCRETRTKITQLTETDYAVAKADVDRLRQELGQPPLPSLQSTLDEKTSQYLTERRMSGNDAQQPSQSATAPVRNTPALSTAAVAATSGSASTTTTTTKNANNKRSASSSIPHDGLSKKPRGRPKGSKNKSKHSGNEGD
ncbi:LOW QUALITY PROTEIN: hypothetical protein CVT25_009817 [Psilocybe cyanescens]|uniref:Uncharacterized protein n=1 Tax=Psilocybe cyanescens TaxID=93625 RepID=A0A409X888_PSICY|nr:LOW QUALITY PROTEIN: hypothetical protein CVT25_009817 [Psilocybe cyanescens]